MSLRTISFTAVPRCKQTPPKMSTFVDGSVLLIYCKEVGSGLLSHRWDLMPSDRGTGLCYTAPKPTAEREDSVTAGLVRSTAERETTSKLLLPSTFLLSREFKLVCVLLILSRTMKKSCFKRLCVKWHWSELGESGFITVKPMKFHTCKSAIFGQIHIHHILVYFL